MEASPAPVVSVLMPVYNADRYVGEAVASVLRQTFTDFELLVFDDGSSDRSAAVVEERCGGDPRLCLFRASHAGLGTWLREGVHRARGEFIARMDADDLCRPERFARQLDFLRRDPACSAVGGAVLLVDPEGRPIRELRTPLAHEEIEVLLLRGRGDAIIHPAVMLRRADLIAAGGYRAETEPAEDLDLYLRLAERGRLANLPDTLLDYRQHLTKVNNRRAGEQRRAIELVLSEARRRRGLDPAQGPALPAVPEQMPPVECWRRWAREAAEGGNLRTARRHAWAAFRAEPTQPRSWQILLRALLGLRIEPLRRQWRLR
jgi:glycosyltransferase involved in cell wall biosynthesis